MAKKPAKVSSPTKIGDLLGLFFEQHQPSSFSEEAKVFQHWKAAVGPEVAKRAQPKSMRNQVLFVEVEHSAWITELNARRHLILRKLNSLAGGEIVKEMHFRRAKS